MKKIELDYENNTLTVYGFYDKINREFDIHKIETDLELTNDDYSAIEAKALYECENTTKILD